MKITSRLGALACLGLATSFSAVAQSPAEPPRPGSAASAPRGPSDMIVRPPAVGNPAILQPPPPNVDPNMVTPPPRDPTQPEAAPSPARPAVPEDSVPRR